MNSPNKVLLLLFLKRNEHNKKNTFRIIKTNASIIFYKYNLMNREFEYT